jgi:hypothetical protein
MNDKIKEDHSQELAQSQRKRLKAQDRFIEKLLEKIKHLEGIISKKKAH